jgi:hypothetical protein
MLISLAHMCNVLTIFAYNYLFKLLHMEINSQVAWEVNIFFTTHLHSFKKHLPNITETAHYRNVACRVLHSALGYMCRY